MGQLVVNIGDLYYVPQNVTMLQFNENEHNDAVVPVGYYKTVKPTKVVVVMILSKYSIMVRSGMLIKEIYIYWRKNARRKIY